MAGQKIGAGMVSATDGSAFTSAVTVAVTGDAGSQATGSVGAGACTHEGNGYHTYAPAQAETNYDLVAFTFIGTGAIPTTVQIFTFFPQTGDGFVRLGAPAGASVSADVAAVKAETATILGDTNDLQTRVPAALVSGRIDASVGAMAANVMTAAAAAADLTTELQAGLATAAALTVVDDFLDTEVAAILAAVDTEIADIQARLPAALVGGRMDSSIGAVAANAITAAGLAADVTTELQAGLATAAALATVDDFLDTEIAAILADTNELQVDWVNGGRLDLLLDAVKAKTDALPTDPADQSLIIAATDAIIADTNDIQTRLPAALVSGRMDASVGAMAADVMTAAAAAADLTTELQAGLATAAALTVVDDFLDTEVAAILAAVDTEVGAIKTQTDKLTFTVANVIDANVLRLNGVAASAANLEKSASVIVRATAITGTLSTTAMTTDLTEATDDHYNGRIIIWTSGALLGQATDITDYTGATKLLTFTAVTEAPANTDAFVII